MEIEKNIIFFQPLNPILEELKSELESDESFTIFEMDSYAEFGQVIGIFEKSISFLTELKDLSHITKEFKSFVASKDARLILINQRTLPPHILGMHKKNGLDKVFKANIELDELKKEVEGFFSDEPNEIEIEDKKKFVIENKIENKKEDENFKVKSMAILEEKVSNVMVKNLILNDANGLVSNYNRKSVAQLNLPELLPKLKRNNFKPFEADPEKRKSTYKEKELGGKMSNKSRFDLFERDIEKKEGIKRKAIEAIKKKKGIKFEEIPREQRKRKKFVEVPRDLEKKELSKKDELDTLKKKKKKFVEVEVEREMPEYEKEEEADLARKKHAKFEEVAIERDKEGIDRESEEVARKNKKKFVEVEIERENRQSNIEDIDEQERKKSKLDLEEVERNDKKNKFEEVPREMEHKKLREEETREKSKKADKFNKVEIEREKNAINPIDQSLEKKKKETIHIDELDRDSEQKNNKTDDKEKKQKESLEIEELERDGKKSQFNEDEIKTHWGGRVTHFNNENKEKKDKALQQSNTEKPEYEEEILDYNKFKKQYKEGNLQDDGLDPEYSAKNNFAKMLLKKEDKLFYRAEPLKLKDIVNFLDFYSNYQAPINSIYKFVHMLIFNETKGALFVFDSDNKQLYPIKAKDEESVILNDPEVIDILSMSSLYLKDQTFSKDKNFLYLPISRDNEVLAKVLIQFDAQSIGHQSNLEFYAFLLRGVVL
tara:strand:- start:17411 stop:19558 length:2148 start_codon:yes stop_codon:yes gene_type:complete